MLGIRIFADLPISRKLLVIIMLVTTVALAVSGFGLVLADSILFRESLERDLSALAQITGDNTAAALLFDDPKAAKQTLTALHARAHVLAACIYRPDGQVFTQYLRDGSSGSCPPPGGADG